MRHLYKYVFLLVYCDEIQEEIRHPDKFYRNPSLKAHNPRQYMMKRTKNTLVCHFVPTLSYQIAYLSHT